MSNTATIHQVYELALGDNAGLGVPCSRYGRRSEDCAWYGVALAYIFADASGTDLLDFDAMEGHMSLVVNDSDSVQYSISSYRYAIPEEVLEHLDPDLFLTRKQQDQYDETGSWDDEPEADEEGE